VNRFIISVLLPFSGLISLLNSILLVLISLTTKMSSKIYAVLAMFVSLLTVSRKGEQNDSKYFVTPKAKL
jgi:hypothetical protein